MRATPDAGAERMAVALSGGVDSAVAAAILVEAGRQVVGLSLRLIDPRACGVPAIGRCCSPRDLEDARRVAAHLGIPFYVVEHERAFQAAVIDDFVTEHLAGRTPNPCVRCNERVKFGPLVGRARALGAATLATGHYARLERGAAGELRLLRGVDERKDQSYFLFAVPRADLEAVSFPLGGLTKDEVRARARALGLPNADKAESQEICFVPDGDHVGFVERAAARLGQAPPGPGDVVDRRGRPVGRHAGVHRFTVGQRRGLGDGRGGGEARYVVGVDPPGRRVIVGPRAEVGSLHVLVGDLRWLAGRPGAPFGADVQLRHRHRAAPARIVLEGEEARVTFQAPQVAAAGQAAVFYDGPVVIGGGWIRASGEHSAAADLERAEDPCPE